MRILICAPTSREYRAMRYALDKAKNLKHTYDLAEVGIGMSCTEGARLILCSPDYDVMEEIGEVDALADGVDFDGRAERGKIYDANMSTIPDAVIMRSSSMQTV